MYDTRSKNSNQNNLRRNDKAVNNAIIIILIERKSKNIVHTIIIDKIFEKIYLYILENFKFFYGRWKNYETTNYDLWN